jgi:lysozyme
LGSLQDDYEKDFKDKNKTTEAAPKLLAEETKIYTILDLTRKDLEKYHKEETEQTDAQLVALEEAREKGTGEGIPKLLGPGGEKGLSKTNGPGGQQNLLKTLTEFKLSEFVLSKITPIAQAALASIGGMAGLAILGTTIGTALGIHEVIDHFTPKDAQGNVLGSDNKPSKLTTKGKFLENAVGGSKMALLHLSAWTLAKLGFGQKTSETKTLPPNTDEKGNVKIKKEDVTLEKSTEPPSEAPTLVPPASGNNPPSMPVLQDSMDVPAPKSEEPQLALKNPGNMKLDKDGLDMLTGHEGFKTQPYKDGKTGKLAIGYGHQILPGEHFTTITEPEGRKLLTKDVALSEQAVNNAVKVPITQKMFNSFVDYTYNTGKSGGPALDHITKILNSRNYKATREILKRSWITSKDTTKPKGEDHPINPNLVKRRGEEAEIGFSDSEIAMLPKQAPNQGRSILETQKQTEDKKSAIQTANTGNKGNTVIAPSNTNLNNTNIIAQQHNPRNTDDSYKDARYRDSFSG